MSNISAIEIAALCARYFRVSVRDLTLDRAIGAAWSHTDDATALAVFLIRRHTGESWLRIGRLLNRPGREGEKPTVRVWEDTNARLQRDALLAHALSEIEAQVEEAHDVRVARAALRPRRLAA